MLSLLKAAALCQWEQQEAAMAEVMTKATATIIAEQIVLSELQIVLPGHKEPITKWVTIAFDE